MNETIEELDKQREERGISKKDMSILVGYESKQGWGQALRNQWKPKERIEKAKWVLEYYDKYGYIPTPNEVENGR